MYKEPILSSNEEPTKLVSKLKELQEYVIQDGDLAKSYMESIRKFDLILKDSLAEADIDIEERTFVPEWYLFSGDSQYPADRRINHEAQVIVCQELEKFIKEFIIDNDLVDIMSGHDLFETE